MIRLQNPLLKFHKTIIWKFAGYVFILWDQRNPILLAWVFLWHKSSLIAYLLDLWNIMFVSNLHFYTIYVKLFALVPGKAPRTAAFWVINHGRRTQQIYCWTNMVTNYFSLFPFHVVKQKLFLREMIKSWSLVILRITAATVAYTKN